MSENETNFGFQRVALEEKTRRVKGVFTSVAKRYDVMNDLMSAGLHRLWKRYALALSGVREGSRVLDLASGTGDLAKLLAQRAGPRGEVWATDINSVMLNRARDRLIDSGLTLPVLLCNAEALPFPANYFDCVTIGFGLRNVARQQQALAEMQRVLKPGGTSLVLEFSRIWEPLKPVYDWYSFNVLPKLGQLVANDGDSYRYLAESIRTHPPQEVLRGMMEEAGLEKVEYFNLAAGVVAVHRGYKF